MALYFPCSRFVVHHRTGCPALKISCSVGSAGQRLRVLQDVDKELAKGDEKVALSRVREFQGKPGGLRCFGAARQLASLEKLIRGGTQVFGTSRIIHLNLYSFGELPVIHQERRSLAQAYLGKVPQRLYTIDELKLNGIDTLSLLAPVDLTLGSIERNLQFAAVVGGLSAWTVFQLSQLQILFLSMGLLFLWSVDLISFGGGVGSLVLDTIGHSLSRKYHNRVVQHEAGHFFIAYLLGVLPSGYTLSSLEALRKEGSLNVQAGTSLVDFEFLDEVNTGKLSSKTLNSFSCIALAGVATEYLLFGYAEGGLGDIQKLDSLLKSLGFTQKKADSQVRWALLNTVLILRRHEEARLKLAEAMSMGSSVGSCIDTIEQAIDGDDI